MKIVVTSRGSFENKKKIRKSVNAPLKKSASPATRTARQLIGQL